MSLKSKVVLLTGACGDIGRETARAMAGEGAHLVLNDLLAEQEARVLLDEIDRAGGQATYVPADVSERRAAEQMVGRALEKFGRIDVCIGNAGIVKPTPFLEITCEEWVRHLEVNLTGCFHVGQAAARAMVQARIPGKIIFVSSWVQDVPQANLAAYCVSKSGLKMLAKCMALELGQHQIRVNLVAPGMVDAGLSAKLFQRTPGLKEAATRIIPLGQLMSAADVAAAVLLLCSPAAEYMTGSTLLVDGGNSLFLREGNP